MVRSTSWESYQKIRDTGLLKGMRLKVYDCLARNGQMTGRELDDQLGGETSKRGHYHKRLPELLAMNVVKESGRRRCRVTGNNAIVWRATEGPVQPMPKRKTPAVQLRELCLKMADYLESSHATSDHTDKDIAELIRRRVKEVR